MTQLELARHGKSSRDMLFVAKTEGVAPEFIRRGMVKGKIVIPKNPLHRLAKPCGIGEGLCTKINANIGTSRDSSDISHEIKKMAAAIKLGSDTVMDLSTGPGLTQTRRAIMKRSRVPVGTVPIYEVIVKAFADKREVADITVDEMLGVLVEQAKDGVDFFTIHAGLVMDAIRELKARPRVMGIVSRGGAFLAEWMIKNGKENPFYDCFDDVLDIAKKYDVTLSLGDGLRPGSIADATDAPQVLELIKLGELQQRCLKAGVQTMIEGPGHVPINQVETNVLLEKSLCNGAPFYVLGPLVTDIAPGYDHITSAIGGAIAAAAGADFLCYVTPSEHLALPTIEDVKEGVVASKIAAHAGDIAKGVKGAIERDITMSKARARRDWKGQFRLAIDTERPRKYRARSKPGTSDVCTMCGEYCSIKVSEKCLRQKNLRG